MNENIIKKLDEIFTDERLSKDFCYVRTSGSGSLPFINNPCDNDIIIVFKDEENKNNFVTALKANYNVSELCKKYHLDFHFVISDFEDTLITSCFPYLTLDVKILYSNNGCKPKVKSIQDIIDNKDIIIKKYKRLLSQKPFQDNKLVYKHKFWYYAYITLELIKNKSYSFNEEQIKNINILHDRKIEDLEKRKELINALISEINVEENSNG